MAVVVVVVAATVEVMVVVAAAVAVVRAVAAKMAVTVYRALVDTIMIRTKIMNVAVVVVLYLAST